ncbi:MAG: immunity protein Tsi6 family protein [Acidobacteriota bacterium]
MSETKDRSELCALLDRALAMTGERTARIPAGTVEAMLASIGNQLRFMRDTVAAGRAPTVAEKNSLTLGVIAVRELEATDPEYCDAITEAAFLFKKLA